MASLVLQLQGECLDSDVPLTSVLRKALVVARKLNVKEFEQWINKELSGYENVTGLPPYREAVGQLRAWNPYNGWIPMIIQDTDFAQTISRCPITQSIGGLEDLAEGTDGKPGYLEFAFTAEQEQILMAQSDLALRPTRHLSRTVIVDILDAVRNAVLQWTLKLEEDRIVGQGMTFNAEEKSTAARAHYTINFNAPVGNSQIQQGSHNTKQRISIDQTDMGVVSDVIKTLMAEINDLNLNPGDKAQLQADVDSVESQLVSPRPNSVVIGECIRSITNILEGCAGSILASGLLTKLSGLL